MSIYLIFSVIQYKYTPFQAQAIFFTFFYHSSSITLQVVNCTTHQGLCFSPICLVRLGTVVLQTGRPSLTGHLKTHAMSVAIVWSWAGGDSRGDGSGCGIWNGACPWTRAGSSGSRRPCSRSRECARLLGGRNCSGSRAGRPSWRHCTWGVPTSRVWGGRYSGWLQYRFCGPPPWK